MTDSSVVLQLTQQLSIYLSIFCKTLIEHYLACRFYETINFSFLLSLRYLLLGKVYDLFYDVLGQQS